MDFDFEPIENAVLESGKMIRAGFDNLKKEQIKEKSKGDYVTEYDTKSEKIIISAIKENFPDHSIMSEESGEENHDSDYVWVVDPLDGTTNFKTHNPFFNVSVALVKNKNPVFAVVYSPMTNEIFRAERDQGATVNGNPINVSEQSDFERSYLSFCFGGSQEARERAGENYRNLIKHVRNLRQVGAAALELCYTAAGRFDTFLMSDLNSWDVAAGALIVKEAGGKVTDFDNNDWNLDSNDILASNNKIHDNVIEKVE